MAFPTETVYGLGGNGLSGASSAKIYAAKGRPSDNPLILHIAGMEELPALVSDIPDAAKRLAEAFWPGPMTLIFRKSSLVPPETTGGLDTVAVRMPSHPAAQRFIRATGVPIAAPSANLSGRPSPTTAKHVREDCTTEAEILFFWRRRPDLTPLRGTGACLRMPVAGIRLRRAGSSLGVTPHKMKEHPGGMFFHFGGATRT